MMGDDMNLVWLLLATVLLFYLKSWTTTMLVYIVVHGLGWARGEIGVVWFYRRVYGFLPDFPTWWRNRDSGGPGGWPPGPKWS